MTRKSQEAEVSESLASAIERLEFFLMGSLAQVTLYENSTNETVIESREGSGRPSYVVAKNLRAALAAWVEKNPIRAAKGVRDEHPL